MKMRAGMVRAGAGLLALAILIGAARAGPAPCPGNAEALGTARVLAVDAATTPRVGRKHFPADTAARAQGGRADVRRRPGARHHHARARCAQAGMRAGVVLSARAQRPGSSGSRSPRARRRTHRRSPHVSHPLLEPDAAGAAEAEIDRGFAAVDTALYGQAGPRARDTVLPLPGFCVVARRCSIGSSGEGSWCSAPICGRATGIR